ncbi:sensor histidine kinase [Fodinibius saliphilus]|uniref:sensor histidine kinase n=1 Tax=Fodinibius saliphilus TaxID=1920650 RepID=UPI0011082218|nr:histidine kinase dimerization/phosphoacceptor domain -containing protein [Fodinibius saliphilus]
MFKEGKQLRNKKGNIGLIPVFVVLALFIAVATHYGTKTHSALRAYVVAEGHWAKTQKEAALLLIQYCIKEDERLYKQFQEKLKVHEVFTISRKALLSGKMDNDLTSRVVQSTDIHPDDVDLMIWLTRFHDHIGYLQEAFEIWAQGDQKIAQLDSMGTALHRAIEENGMNDDAKNQYIQEVYRLDQELSKLESSFSATMVAGARWARSVLFWSIVGLGLILVIIGYVITRSFFRNIDNLNQELFESETKFRTVLQNSRDVIYQMDTEFKYYEYMSPAVENMLGYSPELLLNKGPKFILDRIHPEDRIRISQEIQQLREKGVGDQFETENEFRLKTKEDNYIWVNIQRSLVRDANGDPTAIVGTVRDISDRKEHEAEVEESLKEKQTLLEEIHHRVKNNLAVVSSLLELQKNESGDEVKPILRDTQSRIHSIAMIHEKLYQTETLSEIEMEEYIEDFAEMVVNSFGSDKKNITISREVQSFSMEITKAVPIGLILNELLNNSYKHAFSEAVEGKVQITLTKENGLGKLRVTDNGKGLPDDFKVENQQSLGMTLVQTLAEQLEGEFSVPSKNGGATFQITFPIS